MVKVGCIFRGKTNWDDLHYLWSEHLNLLPADLYFQSNSFVQIPELLQLWPNQSEKDPTIFTLVTVQISQIIKYHKVSNSHLWKIMICYCCCCCCLFLSRSCLFLRIESALLEQPEDIDLAESVFLHQLIQPSFLGFHRIDPLIIGTGLIGMKMFAGRNKDERKLMERDRKRTEERGENQILFIFRVLGTEMNKD